MLGVKIIKNISEIIIERNPREIKQAGVGMA
jgi:hypothetical protein